MPIHAPKLQLQNDLFLQHPVLGTVENQETLKSVHGGSGVTVFASNYLVDPDYFFSNEPFKTNSKIACGKFVAVDAFGKKSKAKLYFKYKEYKEIEKLFPEIDKMIYKKEEI